MLATAAVLVTVLRHRSSPALVWMPSERRKFSQNRKVAMKVA
jgi:hypothetical protein